jgi:hypothetical protein
MEPKEMIEFLKQGSLKVYEGKDMVHTISHTCNGTNIYFYDHRSSQTYYSSYNNNNEESESYQQLLKRLQGIHRIEKLIDSKYYPIWTKEDGIIIQSDKFVKLNGKYYTIKFLEKLLKKFKDFQNINI